MSLFELCFEQEECAQVAGRDGVPPSVSMPVCIHAECMITWEIWTLTGYLMKLRNYYGYVNHNKYYDYVKKSP